MEHVWSRSTHEWTNQYSQSGSGLRSLTIDVTVTGEELKEQKPTWLSLSPGWVYPSWTERKRTVLFFKKLVVTTLLQCQMAFARCIVHRDMACGA